MADDERSPSSRGGESFRDRVEEVERRKLRARERDPGSIWFGLGMFGLVGWSIAVPTLAGVGLGWWIDSTWKSGYSWTLMLMVLGVMLGCWNAWRWMRTEGDRINEEGSSGRGG